MRGRPRAWGAGPALAGALSVMGLPGCAELEDVRQRFEPEPGVLQIVETIPAAGGEVDPLSRIDLCLSAEIDPRALESFDVTLHSADLTFDSQQEVQLFSWRAPASRTGLAAQRWCSGSVLSLTPASPLQPGLTYRVRLRPALLGWAGEALDTEQVGWAPDAEGDLRWFLEFRVAGSAGEDPPEEIPALEPGPSLTELFAPGEVFDPARGACSCHQRPGELASARLDLGDPETAFDALVLRTGLEATDFPMVTPRRPAESYLLHKLLRSDDGEGLHGLLGEPMPPKGLLPHEDLVRLAHWIHSGARL